MTARLPAAVLWDMDGTVIDSEPYWIAEEHALVESFGGRWSHDHAMALVGQSLPASGRYIAAHSPVTLSPEVVVDRLVDGVSARLRMRVPWRPGALELLTEVRAAGIPCALVTMSHRRLTDLLESALPQPFFDVVVAGDEVARGKPHPEPYEAAAAALGVDPADCVALEDSETGMRSAVAAGVPTIVVPSVKPVPPLGGSAQVASLRGLAAADLLAVVERPAKSA
ncbi:MAG: HAD family hydrolase [Dermatophilaceae bacterium]